MGEKPRKEGLGSQERGGLTPWDHYRTGKVLRGPGSRLELNWFSQEVIPLVVPGPLRNGRFPWLGPDFPFQRLFGPFSFTWIPWGSRLTKGKKKGGGLRGVSIRALTFSGVPFGIGDPILLFQRRQGKAGKGVCGKEPKIYFWVILEGDHGEIGRDGID